MTACLCSATLFMPAALSAQEAAADAAPPSAAPADGKQVYAAADFARFAPKSALDMVREIPGFAIQAADDDRRGFGQASGNILIDGKRISGKANDAEAALGRINASDVVQIEIVDGATLNVPGLSGQVANVITSVDGLSGNFRWSPEFRTRHTEARLLDGEIAVTGRSGHLDYSLSLSNVSARLGNNGPEFALDGSGTLADLRDETLYWYQDTPRAAATFKYETPGGSIANLNLAYARYYFSAHEESLRSFPGVVDRQRDFYDREREWNYEVGGDYDFTLGGGRFKLIGLRRFERSPQRQSAVVVYADGRPDTGTLYERDTDESESILRGEYRWQGGNADWQVSAEGAINTLDTTATLSELDASGVFQPVPLPGATTQIEEERAEVALSYGRSIAPGLTLQGSIGGEYSQLVQSGAGGLSRTFYRPKGFIALAWKASPRLDVSARLERVVGQLNFYDFAASVNVSGGSQNNANPDLRPPQSWDAEIELNRNLGDFGSIKARGYVRLISDVVAQVPIGDTGEAPGNLDSATVLGFDWNSTINFDPLGWKGAKLDLDLSFRRSRLRDPLTGEKLPISDDMAHELIANFRHDVPDTDWAWGVEFRHFRQTAGVRLDQVSQFDTPRGDLGVFVEHKDVAGLTVRAGVSNMLDSIEYLYRTVHAGRRTDPVAFYEERARGIGPIFSFTIRGSV